MIQQYLTKTKIEQLTAGERAGRWYPALENRDFWDNLDAEMRDILIAGGEKYLSYAWKHIPLSSYTALFACGDRQVNEIPYFEKREALCALSLAEFAENKGRFLEKIADGLWALCEDAVWAVAAHTGSEHSGAPDDGSALPDIVRNRTVDLFAAETAQMLAIIYDMLQIPLDAISPHIGRRVKEAIKEKVITPCLTRSFFWMETHGRHMNNWTPWCSRNLLQATLLVGNRQERERIIAITVDCVDRWIAQYGEDGGCDEGHSYWFHAVGQMMGFISLIFDEADSDIYKNPKIQNMGTYIQAVRLTRKHCAGFSDCFPEDVGCPAVVYHYGKRTGNQNVMAAGAYLYRNGGKEVYERTHDMANRLNELALRSDMKRDMAEPTCEKSVYFPSIHVMVARTETEYDTGIVLAAKGGHNGESHNHNDVGNVIIYKNRQPLLIDVGRGTYTRQTFLTEERYRIWNMQSLYHNLPEINGYAQAAGREYEAVDVQYAATDGCTSFSLDISHAYPREAGIIRWKRAMLLKGGSAEITEEYELEQPSCVSLQFMTSLEPEILTNQFCVGDGMITLSGAQFQLSVQEIVIDDIAIGRSWGNCLYRVTACFHANQKGRVCTVVL